MRLRKIIFLMLLSAKGIRKIIFLNLIYYFQVKVRFEKKNLRNSDSVTLSEFGRKLIILKA